MLKAPEGHFSTPGFFRVVCLMVMKDLAVETRSKEIVYTTIFFAVSCILVFAFGFVQEGREVGHVAAGILWVTVTFAGTLALGRAFERERQNETLKAILIGYLRWEVRCIACTDGGRRGGCGAPSVSDVSGADF